MTRRSERSAEEEERLKGYERIAWRTLYVVVGLWVASGLGIWFLGWLFGADWAARGQFGDTFGMINALFSGLALAGIVLAIFMQRDELELQRQELVDTRKELARTAKAQETVSQAMKAQVETMLTTAQLNALSALTAFYGLHGGFDPDGSRGKKCAIEIRQTLYRLGIETPMPE